VIPVRQRIWDPERDEEYLMRNARTQLAFSNVRAGMVVVETLGDVRWEQKADVFAALSGHRGWVGYLRLSAWSDFATDRVLGSDVLKRVVHASWRSVIAEFDFGRIRDVLDLREAAGRWESGLAPRHLQSPVAVK
jgi:hypothetical protein